MATDGEPDHCERLNPNPSNDAEEEAIRAAKRAYDNGVRVFAVSVGADTSDVHLQDVANAGVGIPVGECHVGTRTSSDNGYTPPDPQVAVCEPVNGADLPVPDSGPRLPFGHPNNALFYKALSPAQLELDLSTIIGNVLSCTFNVIGTDVPLDGVLYFDGDPLIRNDPDGWVLSGQRTVELVGDPCIRATDGETHFVAVWFTSCDTGS